MNNALAMDVLHAFEDLLEDEQIVRVINHICPGRSRVQAALVRIVPLVEPEPQGILAQLHLEVEDSPVRRSRVVDVDMSKVVHDREQGLHALFKEKKRVF